MYVEIKIEPKEPPPMTTLEEAENSLLELEHRIGIVDENKPGELRPETVSLLSTFAKKVQEEEWERCVQIIKNTWLLADVRTEQVGEIYIESIRKQGELNVNEE